MMNVLLGNKNLYSALFLMPASTLLRQFWRLICRVPKLDCTFSVSRPSQVSDKYCSQPILMTAVQQLVEVVQVDSNSSFFTSKTDGILYYKFARVLEHFIVLLSTQSRKSL
jgi:hypothetical protein